MAHCIQGRALAMRRFSPKFVRLGEIDQGARKPCKTVNIYLRISWNQQITPSHKCLLCLFLWSIGRMCRSRARYTDRREHRPWKLWSAKQFALQWYSITSISTLSNIHRSNKTDLFAICSEYKKSEFGRSRFGGSRFWENKRWFS